MKKLLVLAPLTAVALLAGCPESGSSSHSVPAAPPASGPARPAPSAPPAAPAPAAPPAATPAPTTPPKPTSVADAERMAVERKLEASLVAAEKAGLLTALDRTVLERVWIRPELRGDGRADDAVAKAIRAAARDKTVSADEYGAYRALLEPKRDPNELRAAAGALVARTAEQVEGTARLYALADVLYRLAAGATTGPSAEMAPKIASMKADLEKKHADATSGLEKLVKEPGTPESLAKARSMTRAGASTVAEIARIPALEAFVAAKTPSATGSIALPGEP